MESSPPLHGPEELRLLSLLREVHPILGHALDSLGGKTHPTPEAEYLSWNSVSVNHAAGGYLFLRESGRVHASKLLIRPALEAVFSGIAALKSPEFFFRKAYTEWLEDRKLVPKGGTPHAAFDTDFRELEREYQQHYPTRPVKREKVSVAQTAELAGLLPVYNGPYRIYCQFTHGALRAATGDLNEGTDEYDTRIMGWCVLAMLDHLQKHTPAIVPELTKFVKELGTIGGP
jgi:hypothetical protein